MTPNDWAILSGIFYGVIFLWALQVIVEFVRFVRLLNRLQRELPCIPESVSDAFRMVARGELKPEQAALWLEYRRARRK